MSGVGGSGVANPPTVPASVWLRWAALGVALASSTMSAEARERVAMPFTCTVVSGRVALEPASEQRYLITTPRQQQPFTFCINDDPARCRTWMTHRFNVACGGKDVPWIDVVAAASPLSPGLRQGRTRVEHGRLAMELGPPINMLANCHAVPRFLGGRVRQGNGPEPVRGCPPDMLERHRRTVAVFPTGFAPMGVVSARVVIGPDQVSAAPTASQQLPAAKHYGPPSPTVAVSQLPPATPPVVAPPAVQVEPARRPESTVELPAVAPIDSAAIGRIEPTRFEIPTLDLTPRPRPQAPSTPPVSPAATEPRANELPVERHAAKEPLRIPVPPWITSIGPTILPKEFTVSSSSPYAPYAAAITFSLSLLLAASLYRRRKLDLRNARAAGSKVAARLDEQQLYEIVRGTTHQQLDGVRTAVTALAAAPPLRSAITDALHVLERRYQAVLQSTPEDDEALRRVRARLERVLHDLRRLREIGESAVVSFASTDRARRELPYAEHH